jgi:dye decolorizing peroxidase
MAEEARPSRTSATATKTPRSRSLSRRRLLAGGGAVAVTSAAAAGGAALLARSGREAEETSTGPPIEPFFGPHQAGIATRPQTHAAFMAVDLRPEVDLEAAVRMMRLVSDDAERLTSARPVLGDQEPELAQVASRLTVTIGFGPGLFTGLGLGNRQCDGLMELPRFDIDRLRPEFSGGDLLAQVCADDPMVVAHAVRQLGKTLATFARPRWVQRGFIQPVDGRTGAGRNLMGQVDGTVNPVPGSPDFDRVVWSDEPGWFAGGTTLVLRRIAMTLDTWDELDRVPREQAVGRRLDSGAPLTGSVEADAPDFAATDRNGVPVIPPFAHIARARPRAGQERFLRRPYNYDEPTAAITSDSGLLFAAYQAHIGRQFLPVQRRLADQDLLNAWTRPTGSAVFAIPPGTQPGGFIGEGLFT